jgi:membrane protease YdiL (CAAX protease family)
MFADASASVLGNILYALYLLVAVCIYAALIRQIHARRILAEPVAEIGSIKIFGLPEALLALTLISLLLLNVLVAMSRTDRMELNSHDLAANFLLSTVVVLFIATFLKLRGFNLDSLGGFSRVSFLRAASTGVILLFFTYPLLGLIEVIVQAIFGSGSSKQEIVDLFNGSQTLQQRIMIIVLAVIVAPVAEEFLFRFFLYGVFKRYLGVAAGLFLNAILFAAVHNHLPSFAPLFVLAACLTLAYEWSGSLLVSMTMHSLFNSLQLIVLAFPQLVRQ